MKHILTILLFTYLATALGQTKILFDASKAETAGNADWVIDADKFNLDYNPYPEPGGNEANAQKIPTPSQSGITSSTGQNYWKGGISAWGIDAVQSGFQVETLPYNGKITYGNSSNPQDLSNYKVFVVCEPNILFTNSEKTAIIRFVKNGGGLFMVSDHDNSDRNGDGHDSPEIWNDLMRNNSVESNPFGITFDYEFFTETTRNIPNQPNDPLLHGTYGNVTSVEFYGGTSMTLNRSDNPSVNAVIYREGFSNSGTKGVMCAYATFGQGKVVALGDSSPADDGTGDSGDRLYDGWIEDANGNHERLIMNATLWLAEENASFVDNQNSKPRPRVIVRQNTLTVKSDNDMSFYLMITNISGQNVCSKQIEANQIINLYLRKKGIYFYRIFNEKGLFMKSGKFLFNK